MIDKIEITKKQFMIKNFNGDILNQYTFLDYYNRLCEYAINMFEWINLPDTIDERYLELTLFNQGKICFFKDYDLDCFLALQCVATGPFDVYNNPKKRHVYASNGYQRNRVSSTSTIIWNNFLRQPTAMTIMLFAYRLTEIERTIDVNVKAQKTPVLIISDENERFSLKNLYAQYDGNSPVIYGAKGLNIDNITSISTQAPYVGDKLTLLKNSVWNEAMTFLGLQNANQDKKERLITDEVTARDEQIKQARLNMLNARKQACKEINKKFGLNIDVRFRIQEQERQEKIEDKMIEELINNG